MKTPPKVDTLGASFLEKTSQIETQSESLSGEIVSPIEESLLKLLDKVGVSSRLHSQVAANDLTKLNDIQSLAVCEWYAEKIGLPKSDVCVLKIQNKSIAYVKATGVFRLSRDKVLSIVRETPRMLTPKLVMVECTVTLKDGTVWKDVACRELNDGRSVMACSTAATVRTLRLAIGIPIPGEGE